MSRTDRHRPVWVQARDQVPGTEEVHHHTHRECDIGFEQPSTFRPKSWAWPRSWGNDCYWHISPYNRQGEKAWKTPRARGEYKRIYAGRERAHWRRVQHELLTRDPLDVDLPLGSVVGNRIRWDLS